jgi:hypothetical protein
MDTGPRSQVVMMCKTKASTSATIPVVLAAVALLSGAVSTAAAAIASVALAVLVALAVVAAIGIAAFIVVVRRDRPGLWRPAPARAAVCRPALPARQPARAIAVPAALAIEAPAQRVSDADLVAAVRQASVEAELLPAHM